MQRPDSATDGRRVPPQIRPDHRLSGDLTLGAGDTFRTELGGTSTSQFGRVTVGGTATHNGALDIVLVNGFVPAIGNSFQILSYGSFAGAFATVLGSSLPNGNTLLLDYQSNRLLLLTV